MMQNMSEHLARFRALLLFSGGFNILFASPLMVPGVAERYLFFMSDLNHLLHLGGAPFVTPANPVHALLINTAGIDLVLIGSIVLYAAQDPSARRGILLLNAIGRLLFAFVVGYYVLVEHAVRIVLLFALIDVVISVGFLYFLKLTGGCSWPARAETPA
jgi:hypothetical protein